MNFNKHAFSRIGQLALLASVCLFASSCKDDNEDDKTDLTCHVTLNVGEPSADGSEITAGTTWNSQDKIALINTSATRDITALSHNGSSFTGTTEDLNSAFTLAFFYPAEALETAHSDTTVQVFRMGIQDGTPSTVLKYMYGPGPTLKMEGNTCTIATTMKSLLAVADMKFQCDGTPIQQITKVELRAIDGEIYSERTFNFRKKDYESGINNNLIIRNAQGLNGEATLALIPTNRAELEVSVFTADGKLYVGGNGEDAPIVAGKRYNWTFDCHEENAVAHVGDYMYSDMSVSSQFDEEKTCIGIVFALSQEEGGPISRTLTASTHGRIVALNDITESGKNWATLSYDIKGIPNYNTADGKLEEGFLPYSDGKSASSFMDEGHLLATITEDGRIDTWPESGVLSDFKGKENTAYADTSSIIYPACGGAAQYAIKGIGKKRFYCPAGGELALIYVLQNTGLINAATKQKFVELERRAYWVSDEYEFNRAWYIQFATGGVYHNYKTSGYRVRPCLHF